MMSEKQFEHIENKIREAVQNTHVDFDKTSWRKMEALLNKQDKKKPLFWLLIFLPLMLIMGLGIHALTNNKTDTQKSETTRVIDKKIKNNLLAVSQKSVIEINENYIKEDSIKKEPLKKLDSDFRKKENQFFKSTILATIKKITTPPSVDKEQALVGTHIEDTDFNNGKRKNVKATIKTNVRNGDIIANNTETIIATDTTNKTAVLNETIKEPEKDEIKLNKDSKTVSIKKNKEEKKKNPFSRLYILSSFGADNGSVNLFNFNKSTVVAKYGLGLGYEISKKVSVQTGFYKSNKKYSGSQGDYTPKVGSYLSTVYITKVDAQCLIYEIPLSIKYHFLQRKSYSLYTTAGASSYIMKKEDYNYFYKRNNMPISRRYTYTGNTHLFSHAMVSLGLEKKITKKLNLQLEPSTSIPLYGVGEGSVKLYSSSLQIGLRYNPLK